MTRIAEKVNRRRFSSLPTRTPSVRRSPAARRAGIETLEGRTHFAAVAWDGGGDGATWSSALNWSTNTLPTGADDVTINVVASPTITSSGNVSIKSLTLAESLVVSGGTFNLGSSGTSSLGGSLTLSGGTMNVAGTWSSGGTLAVSGGTLNLGGSTTTAGLNLANWSRSGGTVNLTGSVNNNSATLALSSATGNLDMRGGTIIGGDVTTADSAAFSVTGSGNLDGVTLSTNTALSGAGSLVIKNGLTLNSTLAATGSTTNVDFQGTQTLGGTGTLLLDGSVVRLRRLTTSPVTMTIGSGVTVQGKGTIKSNATSGGTDTLINQGTIESTVTGASLVTFAGYLNFSNEAIVRSTAGALIINTGTGSSAGTFSQTSTGTLDVDGGTATLAGAWSSAGLIDVSGGTLNLGQNFAGSVTTAGLGTWSRSGGTVNVDGATIDNTSDTLILDSTTGVWNFVNGAIKNGTFASDALTPQFTNFTLDGVTVTTDALVGANSTLTIKNGLTLDSTLQVSGTTANVDFNGTQTLSGTGTVELISGVLRTRRPSTSAVTLTIGSDITVSGKGVIRTASTSGLDTVVNQGTIRADDSTGTLSTSSSNLTFNNDGTLKAVDGTLSINSGSGSGTFTNTSGGTLSVEGGIATLSGSWSNAGTVDVSSGTLNLGGSFTTAGLNLGGWSRSGGSVNLTGTLNNTGEILALYESQSGSWTIAGGSISGGLVLNPILFGVIVALPL